jgi:hypothetical protein
MGGHCPKDIPCPQNVHARGIWVPPNSDGATQQNGYSNQMMYHVFAKENENESDGNTITTITQTAALMAAPSSTSTSKGTAISAEVAAAINQLLANQTTMMAQMAAMAMAPPTAPHTRVFVPRETFHVPPIPQVPVPMHQPLCMHGTGAVAPPMTNMVPYGGETGQLPTAPGGQSQCRNAEFSNIYK